MTDELTKWTPGPWRGDPYGVNRIEANNPYGHGQMLVAEVRGWGHLTGLGTCRMAREEAEGIQDANTQLIAAAPELYEALDSLLRVTDGGHRPRAARARASAALAKARGEP